MAKATDPEAAEASTAAADLRTLGLVPKFGDAAHDDGIEAKDLAILAADAGLARSLLEKFCSARILSSALRSITLYVPSVTRFLTRRSAIPLPMSISVPNKAAELVFTVA